MNIDIIKNRIIILKELNTSNSEFIVNLFEYYLRIYNTALTPIEIIQNYKYEELIKR